MKKRTAPDNFGIISGHIPVDRGLTILWFNFVKSVIEMNISSYLVIIANLQHLSRVGTPLKDTTIHLGSLYELTMELLSLPDFPLEGYRKNGFQKHDNWAVYVSQNLREFISQGHGSPDDEGFIVKFEYAVAGEVVDVSGKFNTLAYLIQKQGQELNGPEEEKVNKYLKDLGTRATRASRSERSFLDKLKP